MKIFGLAAACLVLAGCSHSLALMERGGPRVASGTSSVVGKKVEIQLDGKTYRGNYSLVKDGYSTFTNAQAYSSTGRFAYGSAQSYGSSSMGTGNIIARSDDGSGIRCIFQFSSNSQSGMGECQDDKGGIWDLQISL